MPDLHYLQQRADDCRRVARDTSDARERIDLLDLAKLYEQQVRHLRAKAAARQVQA